MGIQRELREYQNRGNARIKGKTKNKEKKGKARRRRGIQGEQKTHSKKKKKTRTAVHVDSSAVAGDGTFASTYKDTQRGEVMHFVYVFF